MAFNTAPKPAQCPRCKAWLLAGRVDGMKVAVDTVPLDQTAYIAAIIANQPVLAVGARSGNLARITPARPPGDGEPLLAEHTSCPQSGINAQRIDTAVKAPGSPCKGFTACPRTGEALFSLPGSQGDAQPFVPVSCNECDPPPF